jgi:uncharacterized membrane protein
MSLTQWTTASVRVDRNTLDAFASHYKLDTDAIETALELTHSRPTRDELRRFAIVMMRLAGLLSVAAGVVFFIAANWDAFDVFGRFVLVEALLVLSAGFALWKPPPQTLGRFGLLFAFVMTGVLLALFGQTYQTGADVYELFLTWALLGLPFVLASQWRVSWAAWLLVLNVAMTLYCGWRPEAGWLWVIFAGTRLSLAELLLVPMMVNLSLWGLREYIEATSSSSHAPMWLGRLALACGIAFGTWAGTSAIFGEGSSERSEALVLIFVLGTFVSVGIYAIRQRTDVFPLAAIAGSLIILTTCGLAKAIDFGDLGIFFILSLWLIASSTVSGRLLMKLVRSWNREGEA